MVNFLKVWIDNSKNEGSKEKIKKRKLNIQNNEKMKKQNK